VIVKVIKFIVAKPLNRRLLKVLLHESSAPHSELILYADVPQLSVGKALPWISNLFEEIKEFTSFSGHCHSFRHVFEEFFTITLAFLVDLFQCS
jgi:hypothetical protein